MPDIPTVKKMIIRYRGLFDFDGLYTIISQWMKARRFWFHESKYKHKVPSPEGAEQEITFRGDHKVNEFVAYNIDIDMHLWDLTEVEVVQKGVKKTLSSAQIEIVFSGTVSLDWEKRWSESKIKQFLLDFYIKYIIKEEWETVYGDDLYYKLQRLHALVKDFLDMQAKGYEYKGYLGDKV